MQWMVAALLSVLCSSLCKEQGITAGAVCLVYDVLYCLKVDFTALANFKLKLKLHERHRGRQQLAEKRALKAFAGRALAVVVFTVLFMLFRLWLMEGTMPTFYQ